MREKELRLALVCYGGISLAVYMHGITREIWHLVRASRAHSEGQHGGTPVERAYRHLLQQVEEAGEARLRVLTDIIAGASAGGINGVFLAQAIATGQSLEPLSDLWLDSADVDELIDPEARMPNRFSKLWAKPLIWAFSSRQAHDETQDLEPSAREEVDDKLARFMRSRWFEPPFGGAVFSNMLLDAFEAMRQSPTGPRLLPDAQPLDLFVTVTDFNGHLETLRLNSPPEIVETEHRLTLSFRDAPGEPKKLDDVPALVFAARATASFPGAFPPFSVAELDKVLEERGDRWPGRDGFLRRQFPYRRGHEDTVILIDGSVLANAPFGPAIHALKDRPARREIDRRFVYIDPKPGIHSVRITRDGEAELPGFFTTILGALSDIPREQPIRDNLDALAQRSARIRRTRAIVERLRPDVERSVASLFGRTLFMDRPNPARLAAWRRKATDRAARDAGHSYLAYVQIRVHAVLDRAPADRRSELIDEAGHDAVAFIERYDTSYRVRRLRFLARHLAAIAEQGEGAALDKVRDVVYARLAEYLDRENSLPTDLAELDVQTDAALGAIFAECSKGARRPALLAYLGFPFYDVATLALLQGEGFEEFDEIKVDRISPDDAQSLRPGGAKATLKGIQFNSFGAFFSRAYRENDYLWGRLHGAERMVDIVISTLPANRLLDASVVSAMKNALFAAILEEEAPRLSNVATLIRQLRGEVARDKRHGPSLG